MGAPQARRPSNGCRWQVGRGLRTRRAPPTGAPGIRTRRTGCRALPQDTFIPPSRAAPAPEVDACKRLKRAAAPDSPAEVIAVDRVKMLGRVLPVIKAYNDPVKAADLRHEPDQFDVARQPPDRPRPGKSPSHRSKRSGHGRRYTHGKKPRDRPKARKPRARPRRTCR
jgi:hypothetical protein